MKKQDERKHGESWWLILNNMFEELK